MVGITKIGTTIKTFSFKPIQKFAEKSKIAEINPQALGYVHSNGNISFTDATTAEEYAKKRILKALNDQKPFERGLFQKGNTILGEVDGTVNTIDINNVTCIQQGSRLCGDKISNDGVRFLHGHPDVYGYGQTTPISQVANGFNKGGDFGELHRLGLDEIVAYNRLGEFSSIKRLKDIDSVTAYNQETCDMANFALSFLPKNIQERAKIINKEFEHGNFNTGLLEESTKIDLEADKAMNNAIKFPNFPKLVHNFWIKDAKKYGVEYNTNFSNVK